MITLARRVEPIIRELRAWNEKNIQNVETANGTKIASARFAVYGKTMPPDANSQLRIEYGIVKGYEEDTTLVPYKTTFFGLYDRALSFDDASPFDLPAEPQIRARQDRSLNAAQFRLHRRHHRRQQRLARHQPQRRDRRPQFRQQQPKTLKPLLVYRRKRRLPRRRRPLGRHHRSIEKSLRCRCARQRITWKLIVIKTRGY